ncbi:hypothetical protein CCHR01_17955 [Colletotrichum chrysophilum]|uniref:Uncharacterized protein n=1 Tax=Colletotrichum chrysophilum TaxID=1836956 RepID=A0AAD9E8L1_9PEZI|nr:hypothetical protein CCHR01_17955 [Colletotrichum chrysophilum]
MECIKCPEICTLVASPGGHLARHFMISRADSPGSPIICVAGIEHSPPPGTHSYEHKPSPPDP